MLKRCITCYRFSDVRHLDFLSRCRACQSQYSKLKKEGGHSMISVVEGNVVDAKEDIIAHQVWVNCKGVMGSGVAKELRNKYPSIFHSYKKYCDSMGSGLLGKIQMLLMNLIG